MNPKLYLVGGAVRDEILGLKVKDFDFSCEASSYDEMKEFIISKGWDIKVEKPEYFTIRSVCPKLGGVDVVLCRKDGNYSDGRRPDSVEIGTIYDDLARRDFTAGAIAKDYDTGEIIDPYNGIEDTKNKFLRCVGKTEVRFNEDYLRLLRAMRFSITKGFILSNEIDNSLNTFKILIGLALISKERIYDELMKCFKYDTYGTLIFLDKYSLLRKLLFETKAFGIWLEPSLKEI